MLSTRLSTLKTLGAALLLSTQALCNAQVAVYNWSVTYIDASSFDGVPADAYGINGRPSHEFAIEVDLGQEVQVSVTNALDEATCLHWHGMKQLGTQEMDGVSEITQCSIHPGQTALYTFTPDKAGTYWWHSHHGEQYAYGLRGPLIVHPPSEELLPWEEDIDDEFTVQLADWYHGVPVQPPIWDSILINNRGNFNCTAAAIDAASDASGSSSGSNTSATVGFECNPDQPLTRFAFENDKKYRLRVLNMAALAPLNFSIDEHEFRVIALDGENVIPSASLTHLVINAGQRYDLIVESKNDSNSRSFWMRAEALYGIPWTAHGEALGFPAGSTNYGLAIIDYAAGATDSPTSERHGDDGYTLSELEFVPVQPVTLPIKPDQRVVAEFNMSFYNNTINGQFSINGGDMRRFETPDTPPLLSIAGGLTTDQLPETANAVGIDYGKHIEVVVVNAMNEQHPIHLHSHTPWIVGSGTATREAIFADELTDLKLHGAIMRDVYTVPPCDTDEAGYCINLGYLVLRFNADNPGVWMMHCHIDWHMSEGLAMLFVEGENELHSLGIDSFSNSVLSVCKK